MNDSPCQYCNKNRQEDGSYPWIMPCYNCPDRSEWITKQLICLSLIKDILGDDYDLDRLRELVKADRYGRCVVLPCKKWVHLGGDEWCCSSCGNVIHTDGSWEKPGKKYCEECGAKMDLEQEEPTNGKQHDAE